MSAIVLDMTGRVLEEGESVTADRLEQEYAAEAVEFWKEVPTMIRYLTDNSFDHLEYADVAELVIHSLLVEAEKDAVKHERAADVLEFIRGQFFLPDDESMF